MVQLVSSNFLRAALLAADAPERCAQMRQLAVRTDRWIFLVVIALAFILAVGFLAAWWMTCQSRGMYPALDMPSWQNGGTWKMYCTS